MERKNGCCYAFAFGRIRIWASKELADCRQAYRMQFLLRDDILWIVKIGHRDGFYED